MDEAGAAPDHLSWADDSAYVPLAQADRATFAWEFGRRESGVDAAPRLPLTTVSRHISLVENVTSASLPGLRFALPPPRDHDPFIVQWDWTCDPSVLPVIAIPAVDGFDLRALDLAVIVMRGSESEHILIADGPYRLHLAVLGGTLLDGPVRFHYHLPRGNERAHLMALRRLMALGRTGRIPASLCLPCRRAARWATMLRAWDVHRAGARQRDIACLLWGVDRVREDWLGQSDYLRSHIKRLLRGANALIDGGWRHLLQQ